LCPKAEVQRNAEIYRNLVTNWLNTDLAICALLGYYAACGIIPSRRFGTTHRSHLKENSWPIKRGSIGCPETPVRDYHNTLCNIAEERRSHLQCVRKVPVYLQKVLEVMSTNNYTGLNPFSFIHKHFLQIWLWDVSYERSYCSF
jgi:hypothetical protein